MVQQRRPRPGRRRARPGRSPGSRSRARRGRRRARRTGRPALSMPIPNADVATTTFERAVEEPLVHRVAVGALHPGVVGRRRARRGRAAPRRRRRCPCGWRSRPGRCSRPSAHSSTVRSTTSRRRRSSSWNRCAVRCRFGPVERGDDLGGVAQPQPRRDVGAGRGRGRRGQRDHRRVPEPLDHRAQPQVVGPEVVAPLGDAVRLVDDEQRDAGGAQGVDDLVVGQLLGGEEDVLGGAVAQLLPRPAGLRAPSARS